MSSILGRAGLGISGNTAEDAKQQAFAAVEKLKEKKDETAKTIEEGLGGLKVMLGGKGVTKAILDDPIVKKFGSQLKNKAIDGVKKAGQKAIDEVSERLSSLLPDAGEVVPEGVSASTIFTNPAFNPAEADAAELASKQSELDGLLSKGATRLQDGEDVFRTGYDGSPDSAVNNLFNGDGDLLRASDIEKTIQTGGDPEIDAAVARATTLSDKIQAADDLTNPEAENAYDNEGLAKALPEDNLEAGEFGTAQSGGMTEAEFARAAQLSADIESKTASAVAPTTTGSGADIGGAFAGDTSAAVPTGDLAANAGAVSSASGAAVGEGAVAVGEGAAVGTDVAVGFGESVLAALDAIPGLDLFTLAAGAGLAGAAAAKKRVAQQFKPDVTLAQSGSAFQAGFGNI